jgi:predicted transcriptional regulator
MKVRKFKIRIDSPGTSAAEKFKEESLEDWNRLKRGESVVDAAYDIVLSFPDISYLAKIVSPERMRIYQTIRNQKPSSIYELAKMLGRSLSNVQRDVHELASMGVIELKKTRKKGQKREVLQPLYHWDGFDIAV